jgi:hypothetical protein
MRTPTIATLTPPPKSHHTQARDFSRERRLPFCSSKSISWSGMGTARERAYFGVHRVVGEKEGSDLALLVVGDSAATHKLGAKQRKRAK